MSADAKAKNGAPKAISLRLSILFVGLLIASILVAEALVLGFGYNLVKDLIDTSLTNQVSASASEVNKSLTSTFYYLNGVADAIEQNEYDSNDEIMSYMMGTVGRYSMIPTGAYLALNDGTFLYPSAPDYVMEGITEKPWYKEAIGYDNSWFYFYDQPYFDEVTGDLCATVIRHVHLKDGREGCFAADLFMADSQAKLNEVVINETGGSMMITKGGLILSYRDDPSLCGKNIADVADQPLLVAIGNYVAGQSDEDVGKVVPLSAGKEKYYAVTAGVSGTDWSVVSYAKTKEVLSTLTRLIVLLLIVTLVSVVLVILIINRVLHSMIKKPVTHMQKTSVENIRKQ